MKTIIGAFDDSAQAEKAAQDLVNLGIARDDISLIANNEGGRYAPVSETTSEGHAQAGHAIGHDAKVGAEWGAGIGFLVGLTGFAIPGLGWIAGAGWLMGTILGAGTGAVVGGLIGALTSVGVPQDEAEHYHEAVRRGSVLLAIRAQEDQASRIAEVLDHNGAINIDERFAQYKQEGFMPSYSDPAYSASSSVAQTNVAPSPSMASTAALDTGALNREGETVLPVIEEELQVGKREVQRGGVRVYSHVTETPVQEQVTLREEHVNIERRPVDRPISDADLSTLTDQTIEVIERAEEAVVAKQARVVEEVVVGKEASERTETISDTVRRTDVEVEQIPGQQTSTTAVVGDTRGLGEKAADALTGDRIDDKTGRSV